MIHRDRRGALRGEGLLQRSHLKTAFRAMRRQTSYTFINVAGLAVGLACCLLILLFVRHETRYDRYHLHAGRTYRLALEVDFFGAPQWMPNLPGGLGPALAAARPEVEQVVRVQPVGQGQHLLGSGRLRAYEEGLSYADAAVFDVFTFPLTAGDARTALAEPFTIVLDETLARKYFGDAPAVGQLLETANGEAYRVTGVMRDVPARSDWRPRALVSFATLRALGRPSLDALDDHFAYRTYLLLRPGTHPDTLAATFGPTLRQVAGPGFWDEARAFDLQPLPELYLHARGGHGPQGSRAALYVFSAAALLVLLIACVNYTNLATARATQRAREVGVRKTLGAQRAQLVRQFLAESVAMGVVAAGVGLALAAAALPLFRRLTGKEVALADGDGSVLLAVLGLGVVVGVLSGSYPALLLSAVRPAAVLKGRTWIASGSLLRQGLVTFQFAVTVVLIACTLVMQRQLHHAQDVRLGVQPEQVVVVPLDRNSPVRRQHEAFTSELRRHPGVVETAAATGVPTRLTWATRPRRVGTQTGEAVEQTMISPVDVEPSYLGLLGLRVVAGRGFTEAQDAARGRDTVGVPFVVNEAFVRAYGVEEPLGAPVHYSRHHGHIVGVVADASFSSVREETMPLVFRPLGEEADFVLVRFDPAHTRAVLQAVEAAWQRLDPERPLDTFFLDDAFARLYAGDRRLAGLFGAFAGLAVLVACLGLFGLAAYTAERRTKEIGIRKVMGASVGSLVVLLSGTFARHVVVGFALACPLAYYAAGRWLEGFADRVEPGAAPFLLAGGLALALALATVSVQALRAARANPVDTLRYE